MKKKTSRNAFSLVELLIVVLIIGIISAFAVPAVKDMLLGSRLNQAAALISDQMALARQSAISKNRMVEVRFYRIADNEIPGEKSDDPSTGHFRAFQSFEVTEAGGLVALSKVIRLPDTVLMNPKGEYSTILGEDRVSPPQSPPSMLVTKDKLDPRFDPELPRGVGRNYEYVPMRFRPDGSTDLPPMGAASSGNTTSASAGGLWHITVHSFSKMHITSLPPNYFIWQIDPVTGAMKILRPMLEGTK